MIQRDENYAHYSVKTPSWQRAVRLDKLGKEYTPTAIRERFRYIRLTNLIPELLNKVDEGIIALSPAVELSYLSEKQQKILRYATLFLPHIVCYFPPVCLNAVPAPSSGVVSLTLRKRGHRKIVSHSAGHSVVTGISGNKKSRYTNVYRPDKRIVFSLCVFGITFM